MKKAVPIVIGALVIGGIAVFALTRKAEAGAVAGVVTLQPGGSNRVVYHGNLITWTDVLGENIRNVQIIYYYNGTYWEQVTNLGTYLIDGGLYGIVVADEFKISGFTLRT